MSGSVHLRVPASYMGFKTPQRTVWPGPNEFQFVCGSCGGKQWRIHVADPGQSGQAVIREVVCANDRCQKWLRVTPEAIIATPAKVEKQQKSPEASAPNCPVT